MVERTGGEVPALLLDRATVEMATSPIALGSPPSAETWVRLACCSIHMRLNSG